MASRSTRGFVLRALTGVTAFSVAIATSISGQAAATPTKNPAPTLPGSKDKWVPPASVDRTPLGAAPPTAPWSSFRPASGRVSATGVPNCSSAQIGILPSFPQERFQLTDREKLLINTGSGNATLDSQDLTVKGTGMNLSVDHVYNSRGNSGALGAGTTLSGGQDVGLTFANGNATLHGDSGYCTTFVGNSDGTYKDAPGTNAELEKTRGGGFTLTFEPASKQAGQVWTFSPAGWLLNQGDRNGNENSYRYNSDGTAASVTDSQGRVTTFGYTNKRLNRVTDPTGTVAAGYTYNSAGQMTAFTDRSGQTTSMTWNNAGLMASVTAPKGQKYTLNYDSSNRLTSLVVPNAALGPLTTKFAYNGDGTTTETDAKNNATTYSYDSLGRQTKAVDPLGHTRTKQWTSNSNLQQASDGNNNATTATYDSLNNLTGTKLPTGADTGVGYGDSAHPHLPTSFTDQQHNVTTQSYDAAGNVTKVHSNGINADLETLDYNQPNGTIARVTDGNGHTTSYDYDAAGNLTTVTPPGPLGATHYGYDSLSRVTSVTQGNGVRLNYYYDRLDRVTEVDQDHGDQPATVLATYAYDENGNLISQRTSRVTLSSSYDVWNTNLITSQRRQDDGGGDTTARYTYDKSGNLASVDDGTGAGTSSYGYDGANRLTSLKDPAGQTTTFGYDNADNRTNTTFPGAGTMNVAYDKSNRETSVTVKNTAGTQLLSNTYRYTNGSGADTGKLQAKTDVTGTINYSYDGDNRMTKADVQTFEYDNANNMTSLNGSKFTVNGANEMTQQGGQATLYDGAGNESGTQNPDSTVTYSPTNQVTGADPSLLNISYDSLDNTQPNTITEYPAGVATTHAFARTALGISSETVNGGSRAVYNRDPDGAVITEKAANGNRYNLITDYQGSVIGLLDTTGKLAATYRYTPYGNTITTGAAGDNPIQFTGGYRLKDNLYLFGYRYYNANLGRFTQPDPTGKETNQYTYAKNDPINNTDPTGGYSEVPEDIFTDLHVISVGLFLISEFTPLGLVADGLLIIAATGIDFAGATGGIACALSSKC